MRNRPWFAAVEAAAVYLVLLWYIWVGQARSIAWVAVPLLAVVASHVWHRETPAALGFRLTNLGPCARAAGPPFLAMALGVVAMGAALGLDERASFGRFAVIFAGYIPWAIFQQYALNGFFVNRFAASVRSPGRAAALGAACFAGAHVPNWPLMAVTLIAGYIAARVYLAHRNLIVLGLAHAFVGSLLAVAVPTSVMHGMRTGPAEWHAQHLPAIRILGK